MAVCGGVKFEQLPQDLRLRLLQSTYPEKQKELDGLVRIHTDALRTVEGVLKLIQNQCQHPKAGLTFHSEEYDHEPGVTKYSVYCSTCLQVIDKEIVKK